MERMSEGEAITDEVVKAAVGGSERDRERILESMATRVRAMVVGRLAPTPAQFHAVEDLTQQAVVTVAESMETLRNTTVGSLNSFVSVIVSRIVAGFLRSRRSGAKPAVVSLDSSWHDASVSGPLRELLAGSTLSPRSAVARAEETRRAIEELGRLKPRYCEVITLAFFDHLPVGEIAERMELSRPAASMLLMRAMTQLRKKCVDTPPQGDANGTGS